jgi:predicted peptidase
VIVHYNWRTLEGKIVDSPANGSPSIKVPGAVTLSTPGKPGDYRLSITWELGDTTLSQEHCIISFSKDRAARLAKLKDTVATWPTPYTTIDAMTVANLVKLLQRLDNKETLETDYPADRLLRECEEAVAAIAQKASYYSQQTGQFWLTLKTASKNTITVRVQVPKVEAGKKVPVVLALHGAGGSENLFFDGYGNGKVAKLAAERGWFVVAPRSTITKPGHGDTIDELAKLYPNIDTSKVFVVGHSMGAGEALREACAHPSRFVAIAALGGGGGTKAAKGQEDAFKQLPFYVGVGEFDFALRQSEGLSNSLKKAGVNGVTFKKFNTLEHMIIVQEALPEVYQFFDTVMKR